jgi:hypothetical protein
MHRSSDHLLLSVSRSLFLSFMLVGLSLAAPDWPLWWVLHGLAQAAPVPAKARRSAWPVALPTTATVRLKSGGSLSGRLVKRTASTITLAAGKQSQSLDLSQVISIEFAQPSDLWVKLPNGRRQLRPIRGISLPVDALPNSAIQVDGSGERAVVDLTSVLTDEQFAKLTRNPGVVYVLNRLEVASDGSIMLWVRSYGVP